MVNYCYYNSEIGIIKIGVSDGAVCEIGIADCPRGSAPSVLADRAFKEISEYLNGKRKVFDFPIAPKGTDFQRKVWSALREIPYGETKTYGEIAADIGNPKAARAVGNACNKNPLLLAVPCHRVLGANGSLTGFAAGIEVKERLLLLEKNTVCKIKGSREGAFSVSINYILPPSDEGADCLWQSLSVSLEAPTETAVERWHGFAVTEGEKML